MSDTIVLNALFIYIGAPLFVAAIIGAFGLFMKKLQCIDDAKKEIVEVKNMVSRQSTAMILTSKRQDEITKALHPDSPIKSDLGDMMETALKNPAK